MIPDSAREALIAGLNEGYLGGGNFTAGSVGALSFKVFVSSLRELGDKFGIRFYRDCYHFGPQTGFGFDDVEIEDPVTHKERQFARVYVGGVNETLARELGITEGRVTEVLKELLMKAGDETRMDEAYTCWDEKLEFQYVYTIVENRSEEFGFTFIVATEEMYYITADAHGIHSPVFTHYIILIEIK